MRGSSVASGISLPASRRVILSTPAAVLGLGKAPHSTRLLSTTSAMATARALHQSVRSQQGSVLFMASSLGGVEVERHGGRSMEWNRNHVR